MFIKNFMFLRQGSYDISYLQNLKNTQMNLFTKLK